MERRNLTACDECHRLKLKCVWLTRDCARCKRLGRHCNSKRIKPKRGRKPLGAFQSPSDVSIEEPLSTDYPILDYLLPFGIGSSKSQHNNPEPLVDGQPSRFMLGRLLEHFFSSPNQEHHTRIIRRRNLLHLKRPRPTKPALLFAILCAASYMPKHDGGALLPMISHGEFISIRRLFLSRTLELIQPVMLDETEPTFDDAIASFMLCCIGASSDENHLHLHHWNNFCKFVVRKLKLYLEPEGFNEEEKEERRRLWWAVYMIDRHAALSFNMRPETTDRECANLQLPCPEVAWESSLRLEDFPQYSEGKKNNGVTYTVLGLDLFGILLPLSSVLGDILEYHFLRNHSSFSANPLFTHGIRKEIETNLQVWNRSLQHELRNFLNPNGVTRQTRAYEVYDEELYIPSKSTFPKVVLYGKHLYHCMHILLYGGMDFIQMYNDLNWQSSPEFLKAGEHANFCGKITGSILATDTRLQYIYRYFGTYLLQSSFVFLLLATKLSKTADVLIYENCRTNLHALEMFVQVANIRYQRTFARVMRQVLAKIGDTSISEDGLNENSPNSERDDKDIPPDLLLYRWTAGNSGLWCEEMGVPKDANKPKFSLNLSS